MNGCDAVAIYDGEGLQPAIVEMKRGFNLDLLLQAVERMCAADEVRLAVPATQRGRYRDRRVHRLCRLIGLGLMAVNVSRGRVEVLAEPDPIDLDRISDAACGCSASTQDVMAIHHRGSSRQPIRQQALACAACYRPVLVVLEIYESSRQQRAGFCDTMSMADLNVRNAVCIG